MTWSKLAVMGMVIVGLLIIWQTHQIWSAAFLGVLFALSLNGPVEWVRPYIRMPNWLATLLVLLITFVTLVGLGWIIAAPLTTQFDDLSRKLPAAAQNAYEWLDQHPWGKSILRRAEEWAGMSNSTPQPVDDDVSEFNSSGEISNDAPDEQPPDEGETDKSEAATDEPKSDDATSAMPSFSEFLGHVANALSVTFKTVMLLLLSIVVMLFVAFDPFVYQQGFLWLIPKQHEKIARETMNRLCVAMRWWMVGRLASMAAVGLLTFVGMWMIGMPAPLALGAIAGLLSFVPNIGPIVVALPGLLLASGHSPSMVLWAGSIYMIAQLVESNAITPLVEQYAISMPPGVLIVTQFVFAALGGVWGMIVSTPLLVVVMVLVQQLYVNQTLNKHIEVTGSK